MASPQSEAIRQMLREQKEAAKKGAPSIEEQRRQLDYLGSFSPLESDVTVEKTQISGVPGEWISPPMPEGNGFFFIFTEAPTVSEAATPTAALPPVWHAPARAGRCSSSTGWRRSIPFQPPWKTRRPHTGN